MNPEQLEELAALNAAGALEGKDLDEFQRLLTNADHHTKRILARFNNIAGLLAVSLPHRQQPSPGLRRKLLTRIETEASEIRKTPADILNQHTEGALSGFTFISGNEAAGWRDIRVRGAAVKLLSVDQARGYAVVLGRLEPGARYPAHKHINGEDVFVLSGDLHIGENVLRAGDFHHADAGTSHGENFSETGCTILAVISTQDLLAQFAST
ncbi:MAG: cupin domain-containing protein [Verrucomicrobiota bacterium]